MTGYIQRPKSEEMTERPCLRCRKPFLSEWIGNRLCECCKNYGGIGVLMETGTNGRAAPRKD